MRDQVRARLEALLKDITYKPGWSFEVLPRDQLNGFYDEDIVIRGTMMVPSLDKLDHPLIPIVFHKRFGQYTLERMTDGDLILHVISSVIRDMELHEMDEWLKYRTYNVRDPHPERGDTSLETFLRNFRVDGQIQPR